MTPRVYPFVKDKINRKVLHRRIEKLLNHPGKAMNLINKEDISFIQMGENAQKISPFLQGRAGCDGDVDTHLLSNNVSKRRLTKTGRRMKQDVIKWLAPFERRLNGYLKGLHHLGLANIFLQTPWPQADEFRLFFHLYIFFVVPAWHQPNNTTFRAFGSFVFCGCALRTARDSLFYLTTPRLTLPPGTPLQTALPAL